MVNYISISVVLITLEVHLCPIINEENSIIKCEYLKITMELLIEYFIAHTWPITRLYYCKCKYKMFGEYFLVCINVQLWLEEGSSALETKLLCFLGLALLFLKYFVLPLTFYYYLWSYNWMCCTLRLLNLVFFFFHFPSHSAYLFLFSTSVLPPKQLVYGFTLGHIYVCVCI